MGTAVALLGLAGCTESAGPAEGKAAEAARTESASAIEVRLVPLGGIGTADARLLASLIEEQAMLPEAPFAGAARRYAIGGAVDAAPVPAGTYLVAVLDIRDMSSRGSNGRDGGGARLHRIVEDALVAHAPGTALARADLAGIARDAVAKLTAWHMASSGSDRRTAALLSGGPAPGDLGPDTTLAGGMRDDEDFATAGILHTATDATTAGARLGFDIDVAPAPGDGREALAAALGAALGRRATTPQWNEGRYVLRGEVALAGAGDGGTGLSIVWQVMSEDGRVLGTVTQVNPAGPAIVARRWGALAGEAAEAAASGVLALLARPMGGA